MQCCYVKMHLPVKKKKKAEGRKETWHSLLLYLLTAVSSQCWWFCKSVLATTTSIVFWSTFWQLLVLLRYMFWCSLLSWCSGKKKMRQKCPNIVRWLLSCIRIYHVSQLDPPNKVLFCTSWPARRCPGISQPRNKGTPLYVYVEKICPNIVEWLLSVIGIYHVSQLDPPNKGFILAGGSRAR